MSPEDTIRKCFLFCPMPPSKWVGPWVRVVVPPETPFKIESEADEYIKQAPELNHVEFSARVLTSTAHTAGLVQVWQVKGTYKGVTLVVSGPQDSEVHDA